MTNKERQNLLYAMFYINEEVGRLRHANISHPQEEVDDSWPNIIINPLKDGIKEQNITAYRNFLIEFDPDKQVWEAANETERSLTLNSQANAIIEANVPISAAVYSGNKSVHFLIALKKPITQQAWKICRKALQVAFPEADPNSSAVIGIRNPGNARSDTGNSVCLYQGIGSYQKIDNDIFLKWLNPYLGEAVEEYEEEHEVTINMDFLDKALWKSTEDFLSFGADDGEWNQKLFKASCDLFNHGHSINEVEQLVEEINNKIDHKDKATIRSASKTVQSDN